VGIVSVDKSQRHSCQHATFFAPDLAVMPYVCDTDMTCAPRGSKCLGGVTGAVASRVTL